MSRILAATICACLITGVTSVIAHPLTLMGASAVCTVFAVLCLLNSRGEIYPHFIAAAVALVVICLISSESTVAPVSSTVHITACYIALLGLGAHADDFTPFVRQTCVLTFYALVVWIIAQTFRAGTIASWTVSGTAGAGNLMAAQVNMILPLMLLMTSESRRARKLFLALSCLLGMFAIVCVGSRNAIGSLIITLTLIMLRHRARSAALAAGGLMTLIVMGDQLIRHPLVHNLFVRFRFVNYQSKAPRTLIWEICSEQIWKHPWTGIGPGNSENLLAVIDINHAHNNIVQIALECGLLAAFVVVLIILPLLRLTTVSFFTDKRTYILSLSIVAYLVQSLTDVPIHHSQQTLLLVMCVALVRSASTNPPQPAAYTHTSLHPLVAAQALR